MATVSNDKKRKAHIGVWQTDGSPLSSSPWEPLNVLIPTNLVVSLVPRLEERGEGYLFTVSKRGEDSISLIVFTLFYFIFHDIS